MRAGGRFLMSLLKLARFVVTSGCSVCLAKAGWDWLERYEGNGEGWRGAECWEILLFLWRVKASGLWFLERHVPIRTQMC